MRPVSALRRGQLPEKMRRILVESGARDSEKIHDAAQRGNEADLLDALHSCKGMLLMIDEKEVAAMFARLEDHIEEEGFTADIASDVEGATAAMREIIARRGVDNS